ncbi:YheC/YheD family protein [Siminovitchia terrae]|uniref:YheC/YheD family protein n=1 Tax=Siminovitchia terrae TaxID=1914933 RepID=UPI0035710A84
MLKDKQYILQSGIHLTQFNKKHFYLRILVQKNDSGNWEITNMSVQYIVQMFK